MENGTFLTIYFFPIQTLNINEYYMANFNTAYDVLCEQAAFQGD